MKNAYRSISIILAALGLGLAAQSSMASVSDTYITSSQLHKIHVGDNVAQAKQTWGAPEEDHSGASKPYMTYELTSPLDEAKLVYVSFNRDSNKITNIQVIRRD